MGAERVGELLEWPEAAVTGAPEPLTQVPRRPRRAAIVPEPAQVFPLFTRICRNACVEWG